MSKSDKAKLDGIGTGSNVKSVNGKTGAVTLAKGDVGLDSVANLDQSKAIKSITRSGTTFTATALDGTKTTFTQRDSNTTYSVATSSADGLMSKSDKAKLDGISSSADAVTIKTVKVNGTALTPDSNKAVNVTVPTLANNATTTASGMALDARMGKTLSDQIASVKAGAIDQIVNLTAAGWTGDAAPYSQTVNVTGMTSELLCELFSACPKSATVAEREAYNEAFALVASGYAETTDGSATFLVDEKPAIDIGVRIKSISKANAVSAQTSSDITNAVDAMSNTLEGRVNALNADLANIKFGVDSDGNYGYIKPGADTVTPFKDLTWGTPFKTHLNIPNDFFVSVTISFPKPPKIIIVPMPGQSNTHYPSWFAAVDLTNQQTTYTLKSSTGWNGRGSGYSYDADVYWAY